MSFVACLFFSVVSSRIVVGVAKEAFAEMTVHVVGSVITGPCFSTVIAKHYNQ